MTFLNLVVVVVVGLVCGTNAFEGKLFFSVFVGGEVKCLALAFII